MSSMDQMNHVANSCPGYEPVGKGNFQSTIGTCDGKSCDNCTHWENHKCQINLFDRVLTSLDQT